MARYKDYNYDQLKMIPVSYEKQILPGSFEHSLFLLIDEELDLSDFDQYHNHRHPMIKTRKTAWTKPNGGLCD